MEENEFAAADANRELVEACKLAMQAIGSCTCYARNPVLQDLYDRAFPALIAAVRAARATSASSVGGSEYNTIQTLIETGRVQP